MKSYLLTIFNNLETIENWMALPPDEQSAALREAAERYTAYTKRLTDEGRLLNSSGLSMKGTTITPVDGATIETDGPYVFAKEVVGGFFFFTAENLAEATAIARDCPALHFGSRVEVREDMDYSG